MENVNDKYLAIITAGKNLFWKHGIKKVSVEEICKKAGTSRVTFYKYFPNKTDLALHLLNEIIDRAFKDYDEIMKSDLSFEQKVEGTIQLKLEGTRDFSMEFLHDIYSGEFPELSDFFMKTVQKSMKNIKDDYTEAQKDGLIRKDIKIEFILYFMNHLQNMISDPELEDLYDSTADLAGELVRFFFYGIMPRKG